MAGAPHGPKQRSKQGTAHQVRDASTSGEAAARTHTFRAHDAPLTLLRFDAQSSLLVPAPRLNPKLLTLQPKPRTLHNGAREDATLPARSPASLQNERETSVLTTYWSESTQSSR